MQNFRADKTANAVEMKAHIPASTVCRNLNSSLCTDFVTEQSSEEMEWVGVETRLAMCWWFYKLGNKYLMTYYIVFSSFAYVLKFPQEKPISTASWSMFTAANFHRGRRPICYEKNEHLCSSKVPKDVRTYQNWIFSCLCLFLTDLLLPPMALIL